MNTANPTPDSAAVRKLFNTLATVYDRGNTILTCGFAQVWRRKTLRLLAESPPKQALDIACGTGDFSAQLKRLYPSAQVTAVDFAEEMLTRAKRKYPDIHFQVADAQALPFGDAAFDTLTLAYGLRNFTDRRQALREACRVLKPKGRLLILEAVAPETRVTRFLFRLYWMCNLPLLQIFTGRHRAYQYLRDSMIDMPKHQQLLALFADAGFTLQHQQYLACGMNLMMLLTKTSRLPSIKATADA